MIDMKIKFKEFQSSTYLFDGKTYVPKKGEIVKHDGTFYKVLNIIYSLPEDELHIYLTDLTQITWVEV